MSARAKPVLMVMGTHHVRMDNLSKELKERFGQVNCTRIVHPYNFESKWIGNKDLDLSMVGDDPLDALHIWIIDGDSRVLTSPFKDKPKGYDVIAGCRPRAKRFESDPTHISDPAQMYNTVFDLTCKSFYDLRARKKPNKAFKFWADYYKDKLGVRVALIAQLTLPVPKTVVICDIDTNCYETLKKKL